LNPQLPGGDYYASFVAPDYVQHNQDAFPCKLLDMHDLDVLYNTPSGSQDASHGGIYWSDTPLCPRHSFVLVEGVAEQYFCAFFKRGLRGMVIPQ